MTLLFNVGSVYSALPHTARCSLPSAFYLLFYGSYDCYLVVTAEITHLPLTATLFTPVIDIGQRATLFNYLALVAVLAGCC